MSLCARCRRSPRSGDRKSCDQCLDKYRRYSARVRSKDLGVAQRRCRESYVKHRAKRILYQKKKAYGITEEEYTQLLGRFSGRCHLCMGLPRDGQLVVDHNHSTGVIRGALCHKCNQALGLFSDSADVLLAALKYLYTPTAGSCDAA